MQLHQASDTADWVAVRPDARNLWQRLAASSHGYLTPGNLVTTIGLILVVVGCWQLSYHHYWLGLVLILVGRGCDIIDGWLADLTGTKSPFGRALDALFDKLGSLAALIALYASNLVPAWLLIAIFLQQLITSLLSIAYQLSGDPRQPTREGKLGTFIYWVCLSGYVLLAALSISAAGLRFVLAAMGVLAVGLGLIALRDYLRPRAA